MTSGGRKLELDRDKVLKWSYANPGVAKQNAAEQLGLPVKVVSKLLGKRSNLHSFHTARDAGKIGLIMI